MESLEVTHFDTIVLGTGLPESILASALAQNKKQILHLDERNHYGGLWSSFQLHQMIQFLEAQAVRGEDPIVNPFSKIVLEFPSLSLESITQRIEADVLDKSIEHIKGLDSISSKLEGLDLENSDLKHFQETIFGKLASHFTTADFRPLMETAIKFLYDNTIVPFFERMETDSVATLDQILQLAISELEKLATDSRHYCIELTIKKLLANGKFTEILMNSGVSNYLEFKLTNQTQVCWTNGLKKVPFSKEDVFVDQQLSLIEKRKLMKFLLFARSYQEQPELWETKKHASLSSFLLSDFSLNEEATSAIIHCIGLSFESLETLDVEKGLLAISDFIGSIGRFGNHSLLWTLYGAGSEISQAFCRLCALNNGTYILNYPPKEIVPPCEESPITSITTENGQTVTATSLITNIDHLPVELHGKIQITEYMAHMVVGLKRLDIPDEVRLIVFPQIAIGTTAPIFGLILANEAACPQDQTLIHLWGALPHPPQDGYLRPALQYILKSEDSTVLFKLEYTRAIRRFCPSSPISNLVVCDDPSPDITLENLVPTALSQFQRLIDDGDFFLPKPKIFDNDF